MDFLEHIEDALPLLKEASRVLKPNGLLITHTFNKTGLSWLLAVKAISFFFPSAPSDIHIFEYFKKPENLDLLAKESGLVRKEPWRGVRPKLSLKNLLNILLFSEVSNDFSFKWTKSQLISYVGVFLKK